MPPTSTEKFKRAKDPRKRSPGKRVVVSEEARKAYAQAIQLQEERDRGHAAFLPNDLKGKR